MAIMLVPGSGYIDDSVTGQRMIPGFGFISAGTAGGGGGGGSSAIAVIATFYRMMRSA